MKVENLIAKLEELPPDAEIFIRDEQGMLENYGVITQDLTPGRYYGSYDLTGEDSTSEKKVRFNILEIPD